MYTLIRKSLGFLFLLFFTVTACSLPNPFSFLFHHRHKNETNNNTSATAAPVPVSTTTQIALLVPLQGPLAATGQAIRNGFLAAYYYDKEQQTNDVPSISVIDTSSGDIVSLYQQAVSQGANFVVGPLTKNDVQAIANSGKLPVPTLALNTLDNNEGANNLYQFGLSPQEEAEQVAEKAFSDGHRRALVITPQGPWGQGIGTAFVQRWQNLGGTIVDGYAYANKTDLNSGIRQLLQVTEHKAENAPASAKPIPEHRQDADVVFLAAFPQEARQIHPLFLFYNAGDLPTYSTSLIYSGIPSKMYDQDLNGIVFPDMPWILSYNGSSRLSNIHQHVISLWGNSFDRSPRLYGFGIDAYTIASQFNQLVAGGIPGATGNLAIGQNNHISRNLSWAKIHGGMPTLVSSQEQ